MIRRSLSIKKGINTDKIAFFKALSCQVQFSSYLCMKFNVFQILRDYIYMPSMKASPNLHVSYFYSANSHKIGKSI